MSSSQHGISPVSAQQPPQHAAMLVLDVQMLLGLSYMHGRKILHRDFKVCKWHDQQLWPCLLCNICNCAHCAQHALCLASATAAWRVHASKAGLCTYACSTVWHQHTAAQHRIIAFVDTLQRLCRSAMTTNCTACTSRPAVCDDACRH